MDKPPFKIRPAKESDTSLIRHSWRMGAWVSDNYCWIYRGNYMHEMNSRFDDLFEGRPERGSSPKQDPIATIVACLEVDEDYIIGWMAYDPVAVHGCYVKDDFRRMGFMADLLTASGHNDGRIIRVTHWSKECEKLAEKRKLVYAPSLLHRPKHETMT